MFVVAAALVASLFDPSILAQSAMRPTPAPIVTAESTPWYLAGEPIVFARNIYYPAGPQVFFNKYEMIRSGFYEGVPLYTRTTMEPFSVVFVPVGGGLLQPYERRRAGDVAGTVGSTTPAFPVVTPPEQSGLDLLPQAPAPPTRMAISIGDTSRELTHQGPGAAPAMGVTTAEPVGTRGAAEPSPVRTTGPITTALRPQGLNGVFIEYNNRRWFSSGPAVELSSGRFERVGDYVGFAVYREAGRDGTIYVALKASDDCTLVAPYSTRR
jgi:hypothetical protein